MLIWLCNSPELGVFFTTCQGAEKCVRCPGRKMEFKSGVLVFLIWTSSLESFKVQVLGLAGELNSRVFYIFFT